MVHIVLLCMYVHIYVRRCEHFIDWLVLSSLLVAIEH